MKFFEHSIDSMHIKNVHRRCSELIIIDFHCFARLFITAKQKLTDIFDDDDDDDDDDGDDDDDELFHGLVG